MNDEQLDPSILVIFGITGDLARRKVLPAIYHLFKDNLLHPKTFVVGTSRRDLTIDDLLKEVELCVLEADNTCDPAVLKRLREHFSMLQVNPVEDSDYDKLRDHLQAIEDRQGVCMHRLFYLSIPPQVYGPIVQRLGKNNLNSGCHHGTSDSRLLVEKPFGYDLPSAEELIKDTAKHFKEEQVFRIDHYLAKETAQNILTFRRHNPLFAALWNAQHITSITVTAAEKIGIEGRVDFYEHVGALRDLIQSHLMQLLALTAMPAPATVTSQAIHTAKRKFLESLIPPTPDAVATQATRGQYDSYRQEVNNADSTTETYASVVLYSAEDNWQGIPLTLTTGKALADKKTVVDVCFGEEESNQLSFRIQPNEGIDVVVRVKKPGFERDVQSAVMDFDYKASFKNSEHPDAYERVLVDAIRGDHTLFATDDEVLAAWRALQPIIDVWSHSSDDLVIYASGSNGPGDGTIS